MSMKKNDTKRAIRVELVRNGEVITVPDSATLIFKATNGMCSEMVRLGDAYVAGFKAEDTSIAGMYYGEVEVTYEDYRIETFPEDKFIQFRIYENIECGVRDDRRK